MYEFIRRATELNLSRHFIQEDNERIGIHYKNV